MVSKGFKYTILVCLAGIVTGLHAQNMPDTTEYLVLQGINEQDIPQNAGWFYVHTTVSASQTTGKKGLFVVPGSETSVVVEFHTGTHENLPLVYHLPGSDPIRVGPDHDHEPNAPSQNIFSRQIFQTAVPGAVFIENPEVNITLHFIYASRYNGISASADRLDKTEDCLKPETIPPSQWRSGLPDPTVVPLKTEVFHCIVHHSAGSNTDTNYTDIVRNIYLYHTQVRGWDDIGYNFLTAQNGQVFSGRDAQGVADEDNIQGAHFCAKNAGTMGICVLGDYETALLSNSSFTRITQLLSWKLHKESLSTFSERPHPYPGGDLLSSIAGHRDGCSTLCPGKNVYNLLDSLRDAVQIKLDDCQTVSVSNIPRPSLVLVQSGPEFSIGSDPSVEFDYRISDMTGKVISHGKLSGGSVKKMETITHGMYLLLLEDVHKNSYVFKLIY